MKIILSRKGFDSSNGRVASPILPNGRLLSLPIPLKSKIRYRDLHIRGYPSGVIGDIVSNLTDNKITRDDAVHLDPDLDEEIYLPRGEGWLPLFGQDGKAQSHLEDQKVTKGDLFLFFGWFRKTEVVNGKYRYVRGEPDLHVIYGWLQIGDIWDPKRDDVPLWAKYHPHVERQFSANDRIYVATRTLSLSHIASRARGAGVFPYYDDSLRLTAPNKTRSFWRLPKWFYPYSSHGRQPLSCHSNQKRWSQEGNYTYLETVPQGQEFVLDTSQYPEAIEWASKLINKQSSY
ncbi:MAG: hypothetical protein J7J88_03045 [Dehalococcoidia bacterium]|nr:hypothetical protein [Dehalococcoidia bacterium]